MLLKTTPKANPHRMGKWTKDSKTDVACMDSGDFYGSEVSKTFDEANDLKISFFDANGAETVLKASTKVLAGEIIDATVLSAKALQDFYAKTIERAKKKMYYYLYI